ncbi:MAG TPA: GntR family transcriptional regulator [Sporichthyaceae bacterium]|jgi:DNA-binding GntR family transcriptional regulator|nr:GntR family transcriptional regulator [Sporichthyaceae bacterium]
MTGKSTTRGDAIHAQLRADILNGRLRPGQRLQFGELGRRYQASVGVLREVLARLTEQGLVCAEPQLGFRVVSLSAEDLIQLTEARVAIETILLRQAIEHGGLEWESTVLAVHHTLARTPTLDTDGQASAAWLAAHDRYHEALLEAGPNRRLRSIANSVRDADQLYRAWADTLPQTDENDIVREHRQILDAVLARDVEEAIHHLGRHIEASKQLRLTGYAGDAATAATAATERSGDRAGRRRRPTTS